MIEKDYIWVKLTLMETFPHYYADGYKACGNWPAIKFTVVYNDTNNLPAQLLRKKKEAKPVAVFVIGISKGEKTADNQCQFKCSMYYDYSIN